jgi:hypothetical protein
MLIRFAKGAKDRSPTLTCIRDDGSCTWQKSSHYFVRHDLIHYAVESVLGYRNAFWGLVAQGKDLDDFGTRNGVKDVYTPEEGWAETIVGLLQWPSVSGGPDLTSTELIAMLSQSCADQGTAIPPLSEQQIAQIREQYRALHRRWDQLPDGEILEVGF